MSSGSVSEEEPLGAFDERRIPARPLRDQLGNVSTHRLGELQPVLTQLDPWGRGCWVDALSFDAGDPRKVLAIEDDEKTGNANVCGKPFFMKQSVSQVDAQLVVLDGRWGLGQPQRDGGYRKVQQTLADCPKQELPGPVAGARACQPLVDA
jgi:hypothetical protein